MRDELAAFDEGAFGAATGTVGRDRLESVAREHQALIRARPGVDNIVYEWRRYFPGDTLRYRSPAVYVLALPVRVWAEFTDRLGLSEAETAALQSLHAHQADRLLDEPVGDSGERRAMVLTRP